MGGGRYGGRIGRLDGSFGFGSDCDSIAAREHLVMKGLIEPWRVLVKEVWRGMWKRWMARRKAEETGGC